MKAAKQSRCPWCETNELLKTYHDNEWGVPVTDDQKLFEFMVLDAFQAGLSWLTILKKREAFRDAFDNFNPEKIVSYSDKKIEKLMNDEKIIRNKLKIESTVSNAKAYLEMCEKGGSFSDFIWQFTKHKTITNKWKLQSEIPASTVESDVMSKALKKAGFRFVGSTICYAFMQAAGLVNDHITSCYRYQEIKKLAR
ncbi:MAG: DNA-3-methyladenine glycosylase I [Bacteroidota bacterium]